MPYIQETAIYGAPRLLPDSQVPRPRRKRFTPVPEPIFEGLEDRVKKSRAAAGLSIRELAELAGCSATTIVNMEAGKGPAASLATMARLADALRVPREWLFFGTVAVQPPARPEKG